MTAKAVSDATITFYYPEKTSKEIRQEEFFSRSGQGRYDVIYDAFYNSRPVTFIDTGPNGYTTTRIFSTTCCTACVCERSSVPEDTTARKVTIVFNDNTAAIHFRVKKEHLAGVNESIRQGMITKSLIVISDNRRMTAFIDPTKIRWTED